MPGPHWHWPQWQWHAQAGPAGSLKQARALARSLAVCARARVSQLFKLTQAAARACNQHHWHHHHQLELDPGPGTHALACTIMIMIGMARWVAPSTARRTSLLVLVHPVREMRQHCTGDAPAFRESAIQVDSRGVGSADAFGLHHYLPSDLPTHLPTCKAWSQTYTPTYRYQRHACTGTHRVSILPDTYMQRQRRQRLTLAWRGCSPVSGSTKTLIRANPTIAVSKSGFGVVRSSPVICEKQKEEKEGSCLRRRENLRMRGRSNEAEGSFW
eukprot:1217614-Rhodomonas_salina.2